MTESSLQKGFGGGCGLVLGVILTLVAIPLVGFGAEPTINCLAIKAGDMGTLDATAITVLQVLDDQTMLVIPEKRVSEMYSVGPQIKQRLVTKRGTVFMLRGRSTVGIADDQRITVKTPLRVIGTESYETALGSERTVFVLSPVDQAKIRAEQAKQDEEKREADEDRAKAKQERQQAIEAARWRTWTTADGKYKVHAAFRGVMSGVVRLEREDGSVIQVKLDLFCDDDRQWIEDRGWERGADEVGKTEEPTPK